MTMKRRQHSAQSKVMIALEAVKERKTVHELAGEYGVHPTQISQWKRQLLEGLPDLFSSRRGQGARDEQALQEELYQEIGRLKMELEWLKKKLPSSTTEKRVLIERGHAAFSLQRPCELVGLPRAGLYDVPAEETAANLRLMRLIDAPDTEAPCYGSRRMTAWLRRAGYGVNRKRVQRLMHTMGLEAISPRPRLSQGGADHRVYPSRLRDLVPHRPNQVWSADITSVPLRHGCMDLGAILDWQSRYVVAWHRSQTRDVACCLTALAEALAHGCPELFNTDQGAPLTSLAFTTRLQVAQVAISMDGRGRVCDTIFVERFWRTVTYEDIDLKEYHTVLALEGGVGEYVGFYHHQRLHEALDYRTPAEVHCSEGR